MRQLCIFKVDSEGWWEYMDYFSEHCDHPKTYNLCGNTITEEYNILDESGRKAVIKCIDDSFDKNSGPDIHSQTNSIIEY